MRVLIFDEHVSQWVYSSLLNQDITLINDTVQNNTLHVK